MDRFTGKDWVSQDRSGGLRGGSGRADQGRVLTVGAISSQTGWPPRAAGTDFAQKVRTEEIGCWSDSDAPEKCFSQTFKKDEGMRCDYFTCKDCKLNWICRRCSDCCHSGHKVVEYIMNHPATWVCSMSRNGSSLMNVGGLVATVQRERTVKRINEWTCSCWII